MFKTYLEAQIHAANIVAALTKNPIIYSDYSGEDPITTGSIGILMDKEIKDTSRYSVVLCMEGKSHTMNHLLLVKDKVILTKLASCIFEYSVKFDEYEEVFSNTQNGSFAKKIELVYSF